MNMSHVKFDFSHCLFTHWRFTFSFICDRIFHRMGIPILHMLSKTWSELTFVCVNSSFSPAVSHFLTCEQTFWHLTPSLICHMWIPNCLPISRDRLTVFLMWAKIWHVKIKWRMWKFFSQVDHIHSYLTDVFHTWLTIFECGDKMLNLKFFTQSPTRSRVIGYIVYKWTLFDRLK